MFVRAHHRAAAAISSAVPKEGEFDHAPRGIIHARQPRETTCASRLLLRGPGRVRKGAFGGAVAQQDMALILALPFVFAALTEDEVRRSVAEAPGLRVPARH